MKHVVPEVPGYPLPKSEAMSILGSGIRTRRGSHDCSKRRALLSESGDCEHLGKHPLAMEVLVFGPVGGPRNNATNYLVEHR